ncbi:helix-turn-helix domain-containing protein [Nonomuraea typhae]|uniref:helix-turn-helix domain-containing protein n=1 Tax=Nonomuraea typhae TaxID=2603600 RepID=UPI0012F75F95|nr:helix-turn-helix transcriptional regulator [Nonomuraea typhae]
MASPTLRQRQLARRLRELRHEAGLSIAEVAEQLLCSQAKISRIETAQRRTSLRDVRDLCSLYGVDDPSALMELAREARNTSWWLESENSDLRPLIGLETEAIKMTQYDTTTVPGLLQTAEYARAVIRGYLPLIAPKVLDERVEVRMRRQEVLSKADPPLYWVLLDESALQRHIGGAQVMADQLRRLLEAAELSHVILQIIPYTVGAHMGLDAAFTLLEFDLDAGVSDTVYMETLLHIYYEEKPQQLARFAEILNQLRATALSPQESANRISRYQVQFERQAAQESL